MTARRRWLLAVLALLLVGIAFVLVPAWRETRAESAASQVAVPKNAKVTLLLPPRDFPAGAISPEFGVTATHVAVMKLDGNLRVAEHFDASNPDVREIEVRGAQPESFALDAGGSILGIRAGYLGNLDDTGNFGEAIPLPIAGMRLAGSHHHDVLYLFGGTPGAYRLYRLFADGRLRIVLDIDRPIIAVDDHGDDIYVATSDRVLKVKPGAPESLYWAPRGTSIESIAVGKDGQVFFATARKVFALLGPNALSVVNNAGGSLRTEGDALYVLDPRRRLFFRMQPADSSLFKEILH